MTEWLTILLRIREVPDSVSALSILFEVFRGISQSLQGQHLKN
jgi:hypothetical protein